MPEARLVIRDLCKSYASPVLSDVSLSFDRGEVHAIVGENGAGKTTLVNILAGLTGRDSGELTLDNRNYDPQRPADAFARGISFAAQELSTVPTLTIAENLGLKRLPRRFGVIQKDALRESATDTLERVGLGALHADTPVSALGLADRQLLELAKAMTGDPDLLLLDEPTAALTKPQADRLHALIKALADSGTTIIYISHRLDDVLEVADQVSVLRDGRLVASGAAGEFSVDSLVHHMAGNVFDTTTAESAGPEGAPLLELDGVTTADLPHPLSLAVNAGEIVGLAGLAGAGRSELLHAAFRLAPLTGGAVTRHSNDGAVPIGSPQAAVDAGVALLGEDRQSMGIYPGQSLLTNMMLPGKRRQRSDLALIDRQQESGAASELVEKLAIRCQDTQQDIAELSGGNQQKALLARWLHCGSEVFLLDEPTRGVDVATKSTIYELLRELAGEGCGIALASSEIEELMTVCDRIVVLSDRRIVREFDRSDWSERDILAAAFSGFTNTGRTH
jgi:ribose transport system ATP-binding protein